MSEEGDRHKLLCVLGYLRGVMAMIPKGLFVKLGGAFIFFGSKKQKYDSKSPEIVAWSDNVGFVAKLGKLLNFLFNSEGKVPEIYQYHTLVISLVTQDGSATRMKRMRTRMNLVIDVKRKE